MSNGLPSYETVTDSTGRVRRRAIFTDNLEDKDEDDEEYESDSDDDSDIEEEESEEEEVQEMAPPKKKSKVSICFRVVHRIKGILPSCFTNFS